MLVVVTLLSCQAESLGSFTQKKTIVGPKANRYDSIYILSAAIVVLLIDYFFD